MAKIIDLNTKREFENNQLNDYMIIRNNFINYGIWLGKNSLKDTIVNYENYMCSDEYINQFN